LPFSGTISFFFDELPLLLDPEQLTRARRRRAMAFLATMPEHDAHHPYRAMAGALRDTVRRSCMSLPLCSVTTFSVTRSPGVPQSSMIVA
jgi:hypothetical protein